MRIRVLQPLPLLKEVFLLTIVIAVVLLKQTTHNSWFGDGVFFVSNGDDADLARLAKAGIVAERVVC